MEIKVGTVRHPSKQDLTLSIGEVNLYSVFIIIPITVIYGAGYSSIWGWGKMISDITVLYEQYLLSLAILVAGAVLHELLHAVVWAVAGSFSIHMFRFGFNAKGLAPYAHCTSPMHARAYRRGAAAPGLFLGVIPFGLALATGNPYLMSFGLIFTLIAGGDFLMLWKVRHLGSLALVRDHPTRVGCEVVHTV